MADKVESVKPYPLEKGSSQDFSIDEAQNKVKFLLDLQV